MTTANITEASKAVFVRFADDAVNWSGYPMIGGNVVLSESEKGNFTHLKKLGLLNTFEDERWQYVKFTQEGLRYAESLGYNVDYETNEIWK